MASGVREGRGDTKTWDLDQKSGTWDEKRISEPAKVESSSANFSMDQVLDTFFFLSKSDIIIHLPFTMHLKTNCLKTRYKILQLLIGFASLATNNFAFVLKLCFWKIGRLSDLKFHFSKMNYST